MKPTISPKYITILLLIVLNAQLIYCDLPIHCFKSQVQGDWEFSITKPVQFKSMLENTCGHHIPDNEKTSYKAMSDDKNPFVENSKLKLSLNANGQVHEISSNQTQVSQGQSWTMIYNEGFEIQLKNNITILLFNKYFKAPQNQNGYLSNCAQTLVGWYQDLSKKEYACIKGVKMNSPDIINSEANSQIVLQNNITEKNTASVKSSFRQVGVKKSNLMQQVLSGQEQLVKEANRLRFVSDREIGQQQLKYLVNKVNQDSSHLWKADLHEKLRFMSIQELNKMAGRFKQSYQSEPLNLQDNQQQNNKNEQSKDNYGLPLNFSWENHLPEPVEQGQCGSCFAVSSLQMLETRLKIKYNTTMKLSLKHLLDCSYYNQGCDGGYPYLVGKFAHDLHLLEEGACVHQKTAKFENKCNFHCNDVKRIVKVSDYYYIGGSYGKSTERNIMEEIHKNGPVVVSISPDLSFTVYKKGIYHKPNNTNWFSQGQQKPEWISVTHSVLCYGWGQNENGDKYWLVQNTWGKDWGANGRIQIKRGVDEIGIESTVEAGIPYIVDLNQNESTQISNIYQQLQK